MGCHNAQCDDIMKKWLHSTIIAYQSWMCNVHKKNQEKDKTQETKGDY